MPLKETDERTLLKKLANGEEQAFAWVFNTFQPALIFFANRILSSQDITESEEIVQDVLLRFYDKRKSFERLSAIKAFLYISTKNSCLQLLEKDKVRQRRFEDYRHQYTDVEESILSDIIYAEVIRELTDAIELLPPKCQVVMKLFLEEGKSANEISELLDISVSTVNNQKSKAILHLRKRLSKEAFFLISIFF